MIDSNHTDIEKAMDFIKGAVKIAPVYYVSGIGKGGIIRTTFRLTFLSTLM